MNGDYEFNEKGEWTDEKKISTMEDLLNQHLSVVAYANSVTASEPSVGSKNIGFHNISFSCKGKFGKVQQYDFIGEIETNNFFLFTLNYFKDGTLTLDVSDYASASQKSKSFVTSPTWKISLETNAEVIENNAAEISNPDSQGYRIYRWEISPVPGSRRGNSEYQDIPRFKARINRNENSDGMLNRRWDCLSGRYQYVEKKPSNEQKR